MLEAIFPNRQRRQTLTLVCFAFFSLSKVFSQEPLDVLSTFIASGYMGDHDKIQLYESWKAEPYDSTDVDSFCVKVTYTPGNIGWAGIYWQNRANNWGEFPGDNLSRKGFTSIVFWARGERGGELVEFKAGDIADPKKRYKDSFKATLGKIRLDRQWKKYTISLKGKNLSSVIGGFCWVASGNANLAGLTFYLDSVRYVK